jgi:hypothetical protein
MELTTIYTCSFNGCCGWPIQGTYYLSPQKIIVPFVF